MIKIIYFHFERCFRNRHKNSKICEMKTMACHVCSVVAMQLTTICWPGSFFVAWRKVPENTMRYFWLVSLEEIQKNKMDGIGKTVNEKQTKCFNIVTLWMPSWWNEAQIFDKEFFIEREVGETANYWYEWNV